MAVSPGEIFAIMGPSGSGKSTLLHCLAGIFTPDRGEVRFDGQRLDTLGFVFQFGQLVPELTAADNVALPLLLNRVRRRAAYKTADAWLDRLGIGLAVAFDVITVTLPLLRRMTSASSSPARLTHVQPAGAVQGLVPAGGCRQ